MFKLLENSTPNSPDAIPYRCGLRDSDSPELKTTKKRQLEKTPVYEKWLVPGCTLWVAYPEDSSAHPSRIVFISDEEKRQKSDLSFLCSIECCRKGKKTRSSVHCDVSICIREVGAVPTTVINKRRLKAREMVQCFPKDVVVFGSTSNQPGVEFTLLEVPLKICGSLKPINSGRRTFDHLLKSLGMDVSSEWTPDSTHLVMDKFRVTSKLFRCLAHRKPVVNHLWLEKLVDLLSAKGTELPAPEDHLPSITSGLASTKILITDAKMLLPDEDRSSLFVGSIGLTCPGSEAELLRDLVTNCGGALSVIPDELVSGPAQPLTDYAIQKWHEGEKRDSLLVFYEPSRAETWSSLAELKCSFPK